jgi:hypothetical protein
VNYQPRASRAAPRRYTSAVITAGALVAAMLYGVAVLAEIAGVAPGDGEMTDMVAVVDGLSSLTPWAWATLGTYAVILTPVVGLVVTASEYARVGDRRTVALALAVIAILATSAVVAILR